MPLQCWGTLWWSWGRGTSALGSQQLALWLQVLTKHLPWWHLSLEEGLSRMGRSYQHRGRSSPLGTHRLQHPSHPLAVPHPGGACKAKAVPGTGRTLQTAVLKPPRHHPYLPPSPSLAPNTEEPWHPALGTPTLCAPPCSLTPPRPSVVRCHQAPRAARAVSLQIRAETPWGRRQGARCAAVGRRGVWDHCWDRNGKSINLQKYNSPHKTEKEKRHLICYQVHCESQVL